MRTEAATRTETGGAAAYVQATGATADSCNMSRNGGKAAVRQGGEDRNVNYRYRISGGIGWRIG